MSKALQATIQNLMVGAVQKGSLSTESRRSVVAFLMLEGWSGESIAELTGVSRQVIWLDKKELRKNMGEQITGMDVREVAGEHARRGRYISDKLMRKGDMVEAWNVRRSIIADLQSLGFILKAPERIDMNMRVAGNMTLRELSEDDLKREYAAAVADARWARDALGLPSGADAEACAEFTSGLLPVLPPEAVPAAAGSVPKRADGDNPATQGQDGGRDGDSQDARQVDDPVSGVSPVAGTDGPEVIHPSGE